MKRPIMNLDQVQLHPWGNGGRFEAQLGEIGGPLGSRKLGYMLTVVPPGKRAFPRHSHRVNEEMFLVLEGEGELIVGGERYPIRRGDVISCPPGGPETAHQIVNTSSAELRYLGVSTRESPEMVEYPDSGKTGVAMEVKGADGQSSYLRFMVRQQATIQDYWAGET
jgi:uncharacterized cupin superfamily protein